MNAISTRRVRIERGIYLQPNGKHAVCFMVDGKPRFRTVEGDLEAARDARAKLIDAAKRGEVRVSPRLTFGTVADRWITRFEALVASGERRDRTLESHCYYLDRHLRPRLGKRRVAAITVHDVAELITQVRTEGCSAKSAANVVATLHSVLRFALRLGWIVDDPVAKLEKGERPRPEPRRQRVLGREEVTRLLQACSERYRPLVATALFTGMRISELLGLIWDDIDLDGGAIHVRAQLSRSRRGEPACRIKLKTPAAVREIPIVPQLGTVLRSRKARAPFRGAEDWVFGTDLGTPLAHRNVQRRALGCAADRAGLNAGVWSALRMHDLRHTFASHLIVDLGVDVAQVSRILGHAQITTTLNIYTHLFDRARHARELRVQMADSAFAALLEPAVAERPSGNVVVLQERREERSQAVAQERPGLRLAT